MAINEMRNFMFIYFLSLKAIFLFFISHLLRIQFNKVSNLVMGFTALLIGVINYSRYIFIYTTEGIEIFINFQYIKEKKHEN